MILWSAFLLGLASNFHCLGMCGPIALAVPVKRAGHASRIMSVLTYNAGRILIYSILGALFGLFGKGLVMIGFQKYISIVMGAMIILWISVPYLHRKFGSFNSPVLSPIHKLKSIFQKLMSRRTYSSIFLIGTLNGLIPCGMVYLAVAGAIATGSLHAGMAYMALFGLGTLPVMLSLPFFSSFINNNIKQRFRKLVPGTILLFGLWLIFRGVNVHTPSVDRDPMTDTVILSITNCQ